MKKALTLILGSFAAYALVGGLAGYASKDRREQEPKEVVCYQAATPLRQKFSKECEGKTYLTFNNGSLDGIVAQREQLLKENDCASREEWKCEPTRPDYLPESEFRAVFGYR